MALGATLYNFDIELADSDRHVYESLALRVAQHPSESNEYLIARVLAYLLEFAEGIEFSRGVSDPDEPTIAIRVRTARPFGALGFARCGPAALGGRRPPAAAFTRAAVACASSFPRQQCLYLFARSAVTRLVAPWFRGRRIRCRTIMSTAFVDEITCR